MVHFKLKLISISVKIINLHVHLNSEAPSPPQQLHCAMRINILTASSSKSFRNTRSTTARVPSTHLRRYSPFWSLASLNRRLHPSLSNSRLPFIGPIRDIFEVFATSNFLRGEVVSPTPNPEDQGIPFSSGSTPLTCTA